MSKEEINKVIDYIRQSMECDNFASGFDNATLRTTSNDRTIEFNNYGIDSSLKVTKTRKISYFVLPGIVPGFNPRKDCYPKGLGVLDWFAKYPSIINRMEQEKLYDYNNLEDLNDKIIVDS